MKHVELNEKIGCIFMSFNCHHLPLDVMQQKTKNIFPQSINVPWAFRLNIKNVVLQIKYSIGE